MSIVGLIAIVITFLAQGTHRVAPAAMPRIPLLPPDSVSFPDSVSILLFASFSAAELEARSPSGWRELADEGAGGRTARVRGSGSSISINGIVQDRCTLTPRRDGIIELRLLEHVKHIRGYVTCSSRSGRLVIIGRMALRDYLASALTAEASPDDPPAYLTALSVLQRNYLLHHRGRHAAPADLCDNTHCQRADLDRGSPRIYAAVDSAMRLSLTVGNALPCYYSVCCGGATVLPSQIWPAPEPGYRAVRCTQCRASTRFRWQRSIVATPAVSAIIASAPPTPFLDDNFKMRLGRIAGFNNVLSNTIDRIERRGNTYVVAGRGFGHRVGLCQEGARRLALDGRSTAEILRFYFPDASVQRRKQE